jgi:hypothetical protein
MGLLEDSVHDDTGLGQKKRKGWKYLIGFGLLFPLGWLVGNYFAKGTLHLLNAPPKTPKEVLSKPWQRKQYGKYGLSIEMPSVTFISKSLPTDKDLQTYLESCEEEQDSAASFMITIGTFKVNSSIEKASLEGGAEGYINGVKKAFGVTDFQCTEENVIKNSINGIIVSGTFKMNGTTTGFIYGIYTMGRICWNINVVNYSADDEVGKEVAKRIIGSIQINYSDSLLNTN